MIGRTANFNALPVVNCGNIVFPFYCMYAQSLFQTGMYLGTSLQQTELGVNFVQILSFCKNCSGSCLLF